MKQVDLASFSFLNFRVTEFLFKEPLGLNHGLRIKLSPSGSYKPQTGIFEVVFKAEIAGQGQESNAPSPEEVIVKATVQADFMFEENMPFERVPDYFYQNSIAIVFPYLRAFISTLTLQAQSKVIALPLLNLTDLVGEFKKNTIVKE